MKERLYSLVFAVVLVLIAGCSSGPFATRPPGDQVAQCRGQMTLERGVRSQFSLDLMQHHDDFALYASVPGARIHNRRVEDITFDNNRLALEFDSGREIVGRITGDSLEFKGMWKDFRGVFTLDLDD